MTASLVLSATALIITAMLCATAARAWRGWLDLRRMELARSDEDKDRDSDIGMRIELAHVRERLRKLEAIASGVDL